MRSIIDKANLGKVIAQNMGIHEQPKLFLKWVNRENTSMTDVLKWATEEDIKEAQEKYNELSGNGWPYKLPSVRSLNDPAQ